MGDPCLRRLVYERTSWQAKALHDVGLQYIFDLGKEQEKIVLDDLREAGLDVVEQQRPFDWTQYEISGRVDCKISVNGSTIPVEIKGLSPWIWESLNSVADMFAAKQVWARKMPAQLTLYLLMDNKEEGLFLFKNKVTGRLKQIPMYIDYLYGEELIRKAETINKHMAKDTLPDRTTEQALCEDCSFAHICLPEINREASLLIDEEIEGMLDQRGKLKEAVAEYEELDKEIKKRLAERPETIIGNWICRGKWVDRKGYTVEEGKHWQMSIRALK